MRPKRIAEEEGKCGGRPCIGRLRVRVSDILDLLAAGASIQEILADYPSLVVRRGLKAEILA